MSEFFKGLADTVFPYTDSAIKTQEKKAYVKVIEELGLPIGTPIDSIPYEARISYRINDQFDLEHALERYGKDMSMFKDSLYVPDFKVCTFVGKKIEGDEPTLLVDGKSINEAEWELRRVGMVVPSKKRPVAVDITQYEFSERTTHFQDKYYETVMRESETADNSVPGGIIGGAIGANFGHPIWGFILGLIVGSSQPVKVYEDVERQRTAKCEVLIANPRDPKMPRKCMFAPPYVPYEESFNYLTALFKYAFEAKKLGNLYLY